MSGTDSLITPGLIGLNAFVAGSNFAVGNTTWAVLCSGAALFLLVVMAARCLP